MLYKFSQKNTPIQKLNEGKIPHYIKLVSEVT